jgi:YD repeat-containing protein
LNILVDLPCNFTSPDGKRTAMLYDRNGNLIQTINRRNLSTAS